MDNLEFASKVITALAWPVTTAIIVFRFRKAIIARIPDLQKLKLPGGLEADFLLKTVEKLEAKAAQPETPASDMAQPGRPADALPNLSTAEPLAQVASAPAMSLETPAQAVFRAAEKLERTLRDISNKLYPHVLFDGRYGHVALQRFIDLTDFLTESEKLAMVKLIGVNREAFNKLSGEEAARIIDNFEMMDAVFRLRADRMLKERTTASEL